MLLHLDVFSEGDEVSASSPIRYTEFANRDPGERASSPHDNRPERLRGSINMKHGVQISLTSELVVHGMYSA